MALVFYYKDMLEKVPTQRTQQFSASSLLPKEPSQQQPLIYSCTYMKKLQQRRKLNEVRGASGASQYAQLLANLRPIAF